MPCLKCTYNSTKKSRTTCWDLLKLKHSDIGITWTWSSLDSSWLFLSEQHIAFLAVKGQGNEIHFRFFVWNSPANVSYTCWSFCIFSFKFAEIFIIENRLPASAIAGVGRAAVWRAFTLYFTPLTPPIWTAHPPPPPQFISKQPFVVNNLETNSDM